MMKSFVLISLVTLFLATSGASAQTIPQTPLPDVLKQIEARLDDINNGLGDADRPRAAWAFCTFDILLRATIDIVQKASAGDEWQPYRAILHYGGIIGLTVQAEKSCEEHLRKQGYSLDFQHPLFSRYREVFSLITTFLHETFDVAYEQRLPAALQRQLKRVGCYRGKIDGLWGKRSIRALKRFRQQSARNIYVTTPSIDALDAVIASQEPVC